MQTTMTNLDFYAVVALAFDRVDERAVGAAPHALVRRLARGEA